jgi:hypothetical protein
MRRLFGLLTVLVLAGCAAPGTGQAPGKSPGTDFAARARQVADAWRASTTGSNWKSGFVPLEDLTVLTGDPGFTEATKLAFGNGWYHSTIMFSTLVPPTGQVRFADGSTLPVPVVPAGNAYADLDKGDPRPCQAFGSAVPFATSGPISTKDPTSGPISTKDPTGGPNGTSSHSAPTGCTALTVSGARLGEVSLRTSRGPATVPAWIFTVTELKAEVARVAVAPSAISPLPTTATVPPLPADSGLVGAMDVVSATGTTLTYDLGVGACDYDIQPVFAEFDDVVVVAGTRQTSPGACIDLLKYQPVTVTLAKPLGARVVLGTDARPLQQRTRLGVPK